MKTTFLSIALMLFLIGTAHAGEASEPLEGRVLAVKLPPAGSGIFWMLAQIQVKPRAKAAPVLLYMTYLGGDQDLPIVAATCSFVFHVASAEEMRKGGISLENVKLVDSFVCAKHSAKLKA